MNAVSRADQDAFAAESQRAALVAASRSGLFNAEIVLVETIGCERTNTISVDQGPRADTSLEKLAHLKPVFEKDGTVTAGNASPLSDGAAAVLVTSAEVAEETRPQTDGANYSLRHGRGRAA